MPLINVKLIEDVFTSERKGQIVERLTDAMVSIEGENMRGVTWVVVEEVQSGDWGIGGQPLSTEAVQTGEAEDRQRTDTITETGRPSWLPRSCADGYFCLGGGMPTPMQRKFPMKRLLITAALLDGARCDLGRPGRRVVPDYRGSRRRRYLRPYTIPVTKPADVVVGQGDGPARARALVGITTERPSWSWSSPER